MKKPLLFVFLLPFVIAGCYQVDDLQEVENFVAEVKSNVPHVPSELPPFPLEPIMLYNQNHTRDPFSPVGMTNNGQQSEPAPSRQANCINPQSFRTAYALEQYPLDSLQVVGMMTEKRESYALIQDPEGLVHKVQSGDYIGQNNGRIVALTQAGVDLEEMVDARGNGCYEERQARLVLLGQTENVQKAGVTLRRKPVF